LLIMMLLIMDRPNLQMVTAAVLAMVAGVGPAAEATGLPSPVTDPPVTDPPGLDQLVGLHEEADQGRITATFSVPDRHPPRSILVRFRHPRAAPRTLRPYAGRA
jgi:hypothetical protein